MGVSVRVADHDDVPVLVGLRRAWNEENEGRPIDDADFEFRFAAWLEREWSTRTFFLVDVDGEPVGMANVKRYERMPVAGRPTAGHWGFVGNVFVRPDRRDVGVGAALMDEVVAWSRANGYERLRLAPAERARRFYGRLGFEPGMVIQLDT